MVANYNFDQTIQENFNASRDIPEHNNASILISLLKHQITNTDTDPFAVNNIILHLN